MVGSRDMTARIYSLDPVKGFVPITLIGHRGSIMGVYFAKDDEIYTVSQDAAVFVWKWTERSELSAELLADDEDADMPGTGATSALKSRVRHAVPNPAADADGASGGMSVLHGEWELQSKHFFKQDHAQVCSTAFHRGNNLLVIGFSSGVFGLYEVPDCNNIHTLSISQRRIHTAAINSTGEWLAFGSATLGQLLVWEWQSETCASSTAVPAVVGRPCADLCAFFVCLRVPCPPDVLKQQGHFFALNSLAYSNDGQMIVSGGDDGKVGTGAVSHVRVCAQRSHARLAVCAACLQIKLWNTHSGFCFVTFKEHTAPVTGLTFIGGATGNNHVVVSCSLDGTVRAYDLIRYRNFRTMTTPTPVQFLCVAADPSGALLQRVLRCLSRAHALTHDVVCR